MCRAGRYPLPSTLLMTVIPAQVAGVRRIVVVSPQPARETLAAAALLGVDEFYRVGGAQAIAALAYGTPSLPRVDKIVGPGNLYVTAAKRMVAFDCGIDMLAGPTEIVVSSERGRSGGIAADLVAQAEHDPETLGVLVTRSAALAKLVMQEVKEQSRRNPVAREALRNHGYVIVTDTQEQAREIANRLAPEHLTVDTRRRSGVGAECGLGLHRQLVAAGDGRLRLRAEPYAADRRCGAHSRRVERDGLSEADHGAELHADGLRALGPAAVSAGQRRRIERHTPQRAADAPRVTSVAERDDARARPGQIARAGAARGRPPHEGVSSAAGRARWAAAGLQREHACLLAARDRGLRKITAADLTRYPERGSVEASRR